MTFGDIFSEINLDSSIIDVIILSNLTFLASKLGVPTINIIKYNMIIFAWSRYQKMYKIATKQKYLNFDRRKTLRK
jgi:D-mannonate dehydratase